jgi:CRP/FNR family transcriptional regulator, cyclic AMP receptor protein
VAHRPGASDAFVYGLRLALAGFHPEKRVMHELRISLLQQMPLFGGIREEVIRSLLDASQVVSVSEGRYFFHEDDEATSMYVLESGRVAIQKRWKGRQYLLQYLDRGDCFGEMALMDLFPRSASVLAVQDCTAIEVSAATLFRVYETNLEQFALIQMNMGREVSRRLREANERAFRARMGAPVVGVDYGFQAA